MQASVGLRSMLHGSGRFLHTPAQHITSVTALQIALNHVPCCHPFLICRLYRNANPAR